MRRIFTEPSTSAGRRYPIAPGTLNTNLRTPTGEASVFGETRTSPVSKPCRKRRRKSGSVIRQTSCRTASRSGSPGSIITSVMRRPLGQWLRSPRKTERRSLKDNSFNGFDWFTTMARLSWPWVGLGGLSTRAAGGRCARKALIKSNRLAVRKIMRLVRSERKADLERQPLRRRLIAQPDEVILQLECYRFAGIIAQTRRRAGAMLDIGENRFMLRSVDVLITEVRPVRTEALRNLAVEARCFEKMTAYRSVSYHERFIEPLEIGSRVDSVCRQDRL